MQPKISIITPSYNQGQFIEETILSIINQGYDNLEYIIIDGGSTDNTVDVIKKYEKDISYWVSEPDEGQSHAINKGIAKATGDVFNWINSDDYLEEGALKLVGKAFENKSAGVFCTQIQLFNDDGNIRVNDYTDVHKSLYELLNSIGLNQQGMYWSMERVKQLNGVNPAFNYSMDLDLWKRYLLTFGKEEVKFSETVTGYFRLYASSKTGIDFDQNFHLFENENNAALQQYANLAGYKYLKGVKYLYPLYDKDLALVIPVSDLPLEQIKKWLNKLFFEEARKFFYQSNFKKTYRVLSFINADCLNKENKKDYRSYKRWSSIKRFL